VKLLGSEDSCYGGCGTPPVETDDNWILPGHAAVLLRAIDAAEDVLAREKRLEAETAERRKRQKYRNA
jgi:hypothetical protein